MEYSFSIRLMENKRVILSNEKLCGSKLVKGNWENEGLIIEYNVDNAENAETIFEQDYRNKALIKNTNNFIQAKIAQEFTKGYDEEKKISSIHSLLFSKKMDSVLETTETFEEIYKIVKNLKNYASKDLIVVQNEHFGLIDMNISKIIFQVNMPTENGNLAGRLPVNVEGKDILPKELYGEFVRIVDQTNNLISALVPDVKLLISNIENKFTSDGEESISFELVIIRGDSIVPFECESAGIKKIISICTALIAFIKNSEIMIEGDYKETRNYIFKQLRYKQHTQ